VLRSVRFGAKLAKLRVDTGLQERK
jgi:hypothetical protein